MLIPFHTKSAFLCKIITHKITKTTTRAYCNSQERAIQCLHLVVKTLNELVMIVGRMKPLKLPFSSIYIFGLWPKTE